MQDCWWAEACRSARRPAGTSTLLLSPNIWTYIEFSATIGAAGAFTVRVGGSAIWLTASGVNTQNSANATVNQVYLDDSNGGAPNIYDDLYILNSLGAENNAPLGEMRVYTTEPSGNGSSSSWTPSAGSNFGNVNQASPDDDTTYNFSDTPGQIDLYTSPAIAPTGTVAGVQVNLCERKDDVGARTTAAEYKALSGTSYTGANNFTLGTGYSIDRQVYDIDPDTGAAWTLPGLNGAQFGINCIA